MNEYGSTDLMRILLEIDEEVLLELGSARRYSVVVVGGSALMLSRLTGRNATHDIDYLRADEAKASALVAQTYRRMVETYEREFKPRAERILQKTAKGKRGRSHA